MMTNKTFWHRFLVCFLSILMFQGALMGALEHRFSEANRSYQEGRFEDANHAYRALVAEGMSTAPLFNNLGNTYLELDQPGSAILQYRRAMALQPGLHVVADNLARAAQNAGNPAAARNAGPGVAGWFSHGTLVWTVAVAGWTVIFCLILFRTRWQRAASSLLLGALLAGVAALALLLLGDRPGADTVLTTAATTYVHSRPSSTSDALAELPAGTELRLLARPGSWSYVRMPDGATGYLRSEHIAPIYPDPS